MTAPQFPVAVPLLTFVAHLHRLHAGQRLDVPVRLIAEPPGRPAVDLQEGVLAFEATHLRVRMRFRLNGFTFKTHGRYVFRLDADLGDGFRPWARLPIIALRPGDPSEGAPPDQTAPAPAT